MTTPADAPGGDQAFENAFEAYLSGRPVPAEAADLAAFAGAVRTSATVPGRPNAALTELLATGLLVDQPPLSARTAKRRRRRMWFFTALFAKIASAGAIAQAATGAGIVLVGVTGLGAAGALPAPVQHTFSNVVSAITPSGTDGTDTGGSGDSTSTAPATTSDPAAPTTGAVDPTSDAPVAGAPAATTSAPKNFGQQVSELAHERNAARQSAHEAGRNAQGDNSETDAPETHSPETEAPVSESPETDGGSSHGGSGGHSHD
jgi:hypothetical protein